MIRPVSDEARLFLDGVARAIASGVDEDEALEFLLEVYRLGYVARKIETFSTKLAVEKLKGSLNG